MPLRLLPGVVEELCFASSETFAEPAFGCLVEDRESMEERDAILGERVGVLWDARVV